jgi:hypothetical protein
VVGLDGVLVNGSNASSGLLPCWKPGPMSAVGGMRSQAGAEENGEKGKLQPNKKGASGIDFSAGYRCQARVFTLSQEFKATLREVQPGQRPEPGAARVCACAPRHSARLDILGRTTRSSPA